MHVKHSFSYESGVTDSMTMIVISKLIHPSLACDDFAQFEVQCKAIIANMMLPTLSATQ